LRLLGLPNTFLFSRQEIQAIEEDLQKAKLHLAAQSGFEDATSQPYTPVVTPVKK
jgi:hypothetical protein